VSLKILLDVDGVLVNWTARTAEYFGTTEEELKKKWVFGDFDIEAALGATSEELWAKIDGGGHEFWEHIPEYPWAKDLYEKCKSIAPTYFLTTPSNHPSSHHGKVKWIHKFTGNDKFRDYMLGPNKFICANRDHFLIDDYDRNINQFREAGGNGILMPMYWNSMHEFTGDQYQHVCSKLDVIAAFYKEFPRG